MSLLDHKPAPDPLSRENLLALLAYIVHQQGGEIRINLRRMLRPLTARDILMSTDNFRDEIVLRLRDYQPPQAATPALIEGPLDAEFAD